MQILPLHNSRLLEFRNPQGAVTAGAELFISFCSGSKYKDNLVSLALIAHDGESVIEMDRVGECVCEKRITAPAELGLMWYYFILESPDGTVLYYGGESGEGKLCNEIPPAYQITVYDKDFSTPQWFREGIMYHIFPDRFRRGGNAQNGINYHRSMGREPRVHEDWGEQPYYTAWPGQACYTPNDFFLGDIKGIREKLDYFKELGVSVIYLNPIFESGSNHRYDTADYRRVDPILGDNDELRDLCGEFKRHGIRVMLDGVFSHTGADSLYFNKYGRYGGEGAFQSENSPYRSWYDFSCGAYRTWWGFAELPEVSEMDAGYLDFIMNGEDSLIRHWAEHGVTSWRLDVADELPDEFIANMRTRLKAIDPDCVLLGEVWEDASNKRAYDVLRKYVLGFELDSVMNYPFSNAAISFMLNKIDAHGLNNALQILREHYPKPFYYALMNLLSSHDIVRAITALSGAPGRNEISREEQAAYSFSFSGEAKARLIALTALQMALPGVPSIYYGDEAGVCGMADPFNRATYPWGHEDEEILAAFKAYAKARRSVPSLCSGFCRMGAYNIDVFAVLRFSSGGVGAFGESMDESAALCLINRANIPMHVRLKADMLKEGPDAKTPVFLNGEWTQTLSRKRVKCADGVFETIVPAQSALLFARD